MPIPPFLFVAVRAVDRASDRVKSMQYPAATDIMGKSSSFPPGRRATARRWFGCLIPHTTKPRLVLDCIALIVCTGQRYLDIPDYPLERAMTPPRVACRLCECASSTFLHSFQCLLRANRGAGDCSPVLTLSVAPRIVTTRLRFLGGETGANGWRGPNGP